MFWTFFSYLSAMTFGAGAGFLTAALMCAASRND